MDRGESHTEVEIDRLRAENERLREALGEAEYGLRSAARMLSAINLLDPSRDRIEMRDKTTARANAAREALEATDATREVCPDCDNTPRSECCYPGGPDA